MDIKAIVTLEDIPLNLIINRGMHYVPISSWTMAKEGSKRVEICGIDDKRQITAVLGCSMTGECHPSFQYISDWDITHSSNRWSKESTMKEYIVKILLPYVTKQREVLQLSSDHRALVIYDKFKGQCTPAILHLLDENNIDTMYVPACTNRLQRLPLV